MKAFLLSGNVIFCYAKLPVLEEKILLLQHLPYVLLLKETDISTGIQSHAWL